MTAFAEDPRAVYGITRPDKRLLTLYVVRTVLLCLLGPWFALVLLPFYFKYKTLTYRFDDEGVGMSWGVLWRREIYLTYARVQDIHLSRGVLERWLGLATIQVQTASGNVAAEMSLVGLTDYEIVRDFLYSRMRGARRAGEEVQNSGLAGDGSEVVDLLTEIRDELRELALHLDRSGS